MHKKNFDKENYSGDNNSSPPIKVQRLPVNQEPAGRMPEIIEDADENWCCPDIIGEKIKKLRSILNAPEPLLSMSEIFSD